MWSNVRTEFHVPVLFWHPRTLRWMISMEQQQRTDCYPDFVQTSWATTTLLLLLLLLLQIIHEVLSETDTNLISGFRQKMLLRIAKEAGISMQKHTHTQQTHLLSDKHQQPVCCCCGLVQNPYLAILVYYLVNGSWHTHTHTKKNPDAWYFLGSGSVDVAAVAKANQFCWCCLLYSFLNRFLTCR